MVSKTLSRYVLALAGQLMFNVFIYIYLNIFIYYQSFFFHQFQQLFYYIHVFLAQAIFIHHNLLTYCSLFCMQLLYLLLYGVLHIQSVDINLFLLADAMNSPYCLILLIWIPPWVTNNHIIGHLEIYASITSSYRHYQYLALFIITKFLYLFLALSGRHRTLNCTKFD